MKERLRKSRGDHLKLMGLLIFLLAVPAGCGQAPDQPAVPSSPAESPTNISALTPTPSVIVLVRGTHQAFETKVARFDMEVRTQVALTPAPTDEPPPLPQPTPTFELGLLGGCGSANGYIPQTIGCWRGLINGQFISVAAGRQGDSGDPRQGLIMVFHGPMFDPEDPATEFYSTPLKLGGMIILSVDGTRFTIGQAPGQPPEVTPAPDVTFTFDLATRQWVSPPTLSHPTITRPSFYATVAALMQTLPTPPVWPDLRADKAAAERSSILYQSAVSTVLAQYDLEPQPTDTAFVDLTPYPTTPPVPERPMGDGMFISEHYPIIGPPCHRLLASSFWHKETASEKTEVCSGEERGGGDNAPALVQVTVESTNPATPLAGQLYPVPNQRGSVEIADVIGNSIVIRATNGSLFAFDYITRQWVSPPPLPSPSPSPLAMMSPLATLTP
jgi:hypothetical protein